MICTREDKKRWRDIQTIINGRHLEIQAHKTKRFDYMQTRNNSQSYGQMVTLICSYSRFEVCENNQPILSWLSLLHRCNEVIYLLRLVCYWHLSDWFINLVVGKRWNKINILPPDVKDIWRKKYFLNHFLILLELGLEHIILSKMNLSNLGVLIFQKCIGF